MVKNKIPVVKLTSERQAILESIKIWTTLANSPDGTMKWDVLDCANNSVHYYTNHCPLCTWHRYSIGRYACKQCLLKSCKEGSVYNEWMHDPTAKNAEKVLIALVKGLSELKKPELNKVVCPSCHQELKDGHIEQTIQFNMNRDIIDGNVLGNFSGDISMFNTQYTCPHCAYCTGDAESFRISPDSLSAEHIIDDMLDTYAHELKIMNNRGE